MTYSEKSLQDILDTESRSNVSPKKIFGYLALTVLGLILIAFLWPENKNQQYSYQTEKITTGSLIVTVSATGKLRPTNQVEVGSELSGIVEAVYVDENDTVTAGQVLAQLDTSKLRDTVEKSRSALMGREAAVAQARATLSEVNTNLYRLRQLHKISNGKIPSQNEIDAAVANVRRVP
jgi:HlyD family secretion protein